VDNKPANVKYKKGKNMAAETVPQLEIAVDAKEHLLSAMQQHHPDWSEAYYHRNRSGGASAERNADFQREAEDMDKLLDVYIDLGFTAIQGA
jgi:hypothetical protein